MHYCDYSKFKIKIGKTNTIAWKISLYSFLAFHRFWGFPRSAVFESLKAFSSCSGMVKMLNPLALEQCSLISSLQVMRRCRPAQPFFKLFVLWFLWKESRVSASRVSSNRWLTWSIKRAGVWGRWLSIQKLFLVEHQKIPLCPTELTAHQLWYIACI